MDDEYLERKARRTAIYDKREIMPKCVITVSQHSFIISGFYRCIHMYMYLCMQEIRSRYPSMDGNYRDYMSTFEAESAVEPMAEFPPPMET